MSCYNRNIEYDGYRKGKTMKTIIKFLSVSLTLVVAFVYISYTDPNFSSMSNQRHFGATYMTMNNPFFTVINNEIKREVTARGDVLTTLDPALDIEKQNEQVYRLIDQNVDAIFINPIDWQKIEPALQKAKQANIPIIVVDAPVNNSDLVACTIASDNYDAGVQCAKDMMQKKTSAKIVLLEHSTAKSAKDRIDGFLNTIKGHPEYQVLYREECEGQLERAMPIMENILDTTDETIDVVMALNDPSALGALAALEAKNRDRSVLVYGVDGSPEVKSLLTAPSAIAATAAQFPISIGQEAVEKVYQLLEGKKIDKDIVLPVSLIKRENISDYDISGWQ